MAKDKDITLTPLELINKIGKFDLDPCGFINHNTAKKIYLLPKDNGLINDWFGKVWLNPPYSETKKWLNKMVEHNNGIALVLASTETKWFQQLVFKKATSIFFIEKRPKFLNSKFKEVNIMRGVVLVSYGEECKEILKKTNLKGKFIDLTNN